MSSLSDPRAWLYGSFLAIIISGSILAGASRKLVIFGWLWFFGALMPSLNFIAIPYWMNDRYVYLSTPGFLLVVAQTVAGLRWRMGPFMTQGIRLAAPIYIAGLIALSGLQSTVWQTSFTLFRNAVTVQPLSSFGHNGLGLAYAQAWKANQTKPNADQAVTAQLYSEWLNQWRIVVEDCPDCWRYAETLVAALFLAEDSFSRDDMKNAERYASMVAFPMPDALIWAQVRARKHRATAHKLLARVRMKQQRFKEALNEAESAVQYSDEPAFRLIRAQAAAELAMWLKQNGAVDEADRLGPLVRQDLEIIPADSGKYSEAKILLDSLFEKEAKP